MAKKIYNLIGDGKTPNKYLVSSSNDFLVFDKKSQAYEGASEKMNFTPKSFEKEMVFANYKDAKEYADDISGDIYLGNVPRKEQTNSVVIEDRISGVIYDKQFAVVKEPKGKKDFFSQPVVSVFENNDTAFTKSELEKRGKKFK